MLDVEKSKTLAICAKLFQLIKNKDLVLYPVKYTETIINYTYIFILGYEKLFYLYKGGSTYNSTYGTTYKLFLNNSYLGYSYKEKVLQTNFNIKSFETYYIDIYNDDDLMNTMQQENLKFIRTRKIQNIVK